MGDIRIVGTVNFEADKKDQLLINQLATFTWQITKNGEYVCQMSAKQAELYAAYESNETAFILKKHNSLDIFFQSPQLAKALCNIIAACKDGTAIPPDSLVRTFRHEPNDVWTKLEDFRRREMPNVKGAALVLLLLAIVSLFLLMAL